MKVNWRLFAYMLLMFFSVALMIATFFVAYATENALWYLLWIPAAIVFFLLLAMEME